VNDEMEALTMRFDNAVAISIDNEKLATTNGKAQATLTPTATRKKDKNKDDPATIERRQRLRKQSVTDPSIQKNKLPIYCKGGKCCGVPVEYSMDSLVFEDVFKSATTCSKSQGSHKVGWTQMCCIYCENFVPAGMEIWTLQRWCCPNEECRRDLHGGVSNHCSIDFH
jgi:hypothetical protein